MSEKKRFSSRSLMFFQLEPRRPIPDNIRRIATEQITQITTYLATPPAGDIHEGIHEARKCFKRLRGLLRMVRPALGKIIYRQENIRFRDAARSLSAMRDAQALVECFDMLEQIYCQRVNFTRMLPLRKKLTSRREHLNSYQAELEGRVEDVLAMLEKAVSAIDEWPLADADCKELARGTKRVYRRARKGWKRAQTGQNPGELHDWRKRTKYLRYHFQLLRGVDNDWVKSWHKGFKELSDLLGDHHDLEVLRGILDEMDETGLDAVAECEFRTLLRERQDVLYHDALELGSSLLKKKPKKMRKSVQQQLRAAQIKC